MPISRSRSGSPVSRAICRNPPSSPAQRRTSLVCGKLASRGSSASRCALTTSRNASQTAGHSGRPFTGRVEARQLGRLAREHALVHGAEHAQRQEAAQGIAVEALDQARHRPVRAQVGEGRLQQLRVERRAEEPAGPRLETERREDRVGENGSTSWRAKASNLIVSPPLEW